MVNHRMTKYEEAALSQFDQGFNCAQAVLAAFTARFGLDRSTALRLASPFGGGVARRGEVCGAVSGALMALGLDRGSDTPEGKIRTYEISQVFLQRFESLHGSLLCRELLGHDISTAAGHQQAKDEGVFKTLCPRIIQDAVVILQDMLEK